MLRLYFLQADLYAKGLIAVGLTPGEDRLIVIGCCSMESLSLFVASTLIGIGYAVPVAVTLLL